MCRYAGDLIDEQEAERREIVYSATGAGCFLFFFRHRGRTLCVDATDESRVSEWGVARLLNHTRFRPNVQPRKLVVSGGEPRICLFACRNIPAGEELLFDYGDRDSVQACPWLAAAWS